MQLNKIQAIKSEITDKIERGDFIILSNVLEVPRETAVSRYRRNKKNEVLIMQEIVREREKTVLKLKAKYNV